MFSFDPKKPLYGFRAKCPHAWRHIHVFADEQENSVLFRPRTASLDWWGTFWGDYSNGLYPLQEKQWDSLQRRLKPLLAQSHIWRVFHLPDPREGERRIWRILWRPDFGYAFPLGRNDLDFSGAYFWPRPANIHVWKSSTGELLRHFENEWHDSHSDVRAALPWCDLTHEERDVRAVRWKRGSLQELERLIVSATQLLSVWDILANSGQQEEANIALSWGAQWQKSQFDFFADLGDDPQFLWRRLQRLCRRIENNNQGMYDLPNGSRNDWILPWVDYEPPRTSRRWATRWLLIERPTQHEHLEAMLFLRDWLQENAPDLLEEWFPR